MTTPAHTKAAAEVIYLAIDSDLPADPTGEELMTACRRAADELARRGLLADPTTRTEWGVRTPGYGAVIPADDHTHAVAVADGTLVRRTVTDWTPAEENEHG